MKASEVGLVLPWFLSLLLYFLRRFQTTQFLSASSLGLLQERFAYSFKANDEYVGRLT